MADFWLDKPWARTVPGLPFYERILNPLLNLGKALKIKDPVKRAEKTQDALFKMLDNTGAPISTTKRWTENVQKVIDQ